MAFQPRILKDVLGATMKMSDQPILHTFVRLRPKNFIYLTPTAAPGQEFLQDMKRGTRAGTKRTGRQRAGTLGHGPWAVAAQF